MPKRCAICKETKPDNAFSRSSKASDRLHSYCRSCASERVRAAYRRRGKKSWTEEKVCSHCRRLLPRTAYRTLDTGKLSPRCVECETIIAEHEALGLKECNVCRKWLPEGSYYASHWGKKYASCQECTRAWHRANRPNRRTFELMKEYGITPEQYDELVDRQGDKCPVCLEPLPPNRGGHVDHVHDGPFKGRIRAIVHGECNRTILRDHATGDILRRAADLIDNPLTDWMVPGQPSSEIRKLARKQRTEK